MSDTTKLAAAAACGAAVAWLLAKRRAPAPYDAALDEVSALARPNIRALEPYRCGGEISFAARRSPFGLLLAALDCRLRSNAAQNDHERARSRTSRRYRCARDDYDSGVLLDANENAYGPSLQPAAAGDKGDALVRAALAFDLHRYPCPSFAAARRTEPFGP